MARPHSKSGRAMLRAIMSRGGAEDMLANARLAVDLEAAGGRWRDLALWILAIAYIVRGDPDSADAALADASGAARVAGNDGLAFCIQGHRAALAMDRQDWGTAAQLIEDARAIGTAGRFDGYLSASLARVAADQDGPASWRDRGARGESSPGRPASARC